MLSILYLFDSHRLLISFPRPMRGIDMSYPESILQV